MITLHHRAEFEEMLKGYKASRTVIETLKSTPLVLMAGLTSSGRNTTIEKLEQTGKYRFVKSDTTRPPRIEHGELEKDGGPYWFKSEQEFLEGLRSRRYVEAAIIHNQQVSGLSSEEIEQARANSQIAITEVTPAGIETYCFLKPDTICIFMLPPSYDEWIHRLTKRSKMSPDELARRKESARQEIDHLLDYEHYKIVVNDDFEKALIFTRNIIENGTYSEADHEKGLKVARGIRSALVEN